MVDKFDVVVIAEDKQILGVSVARSGQAKKDKSLKQTKWRISSVIKSMIEQGYVPVFEGATRVAYITDDAEVTVTYELQGLRSGFEVSFSDGLGDLFAPNSPYSLVSLANAYDIDPLLSALKHYGFKYDNDQSVKGVSVYMRKQ